MKNKITIIGFGTMGRAIAHALLKHRHAVRVFWIDKNNSGPKTSLKDIQDSDFVILAVKPQNAAETMEQIKIYLRNNTILISIMAGISIKKLTKLSNHKKIVRMMPNLGLSIGKGIAVWSHAGLSSIEEKKAQNFINKISDNFKVKNEDTINKVTAISGSGPAYFFLLAQCLMEAGAGLGLTREEGCRLVEKTFSAAAVLGKNGDYSGLIKKIASKGGTTEAALKVFKKEKFDKIIQKAVSAAYGRAKEISHESR